MSDWHYAPVPRQIRVKAMIAYGGVRFSLRVLAIVCSLVLVWLGCVLSGADITSSAQGCLVMGVILYLLFEKTFGGFTVPELLRDILAHYRVSRVLYREQELVALAREQVRTTTVRPRWVSSDRS